jgi:hypothetical protein
LKRVVLIQGIGDFSFSPVEQMCRRALASLIAITGTDWQFVAIPNV